MPNRLPLPAGKLSFLRHAPASEPALSTTLSRYDIQLTPDDPGPPILLVHDALGFGLAVQELCDRYILNIAGLDKFLTAAVTEVQADICGAEDRLLEQVARLRL